MQPSYQSGFYAPGRGVAKHPELWRGCVGAWNPGLGNTGLSLRDWSGNGNNGTLTGGPTWGVTDGQQALDFDGVDDYVDFGVFPSLNQVSVFSVSVSVRFDSFSSPAGFSGIWAWGNYYSSDFANDLLLYTVASGVVNIQVNNAADGGAVGPTLLTNVPYEIVTVFDGTQSGNAARLKMYINGDLQTLSFGSYTVPATSANRPAAKFAIGKYILASQNTTLVNGQFGDTRIYNRALSPNEIRLLAQRPGISYELARRKTYFIQAATSTSQFYDVLSPLIFAGTN